MKPNHIKIIVILFIGVLLMGACSFGSEIPETGGVSATPSTAPVEYYPTVEPLAASIFIVQVEPEMAESIEIGVELPPEIDLFLFSPIRMNETYLMNRDGAAVYTWQSNYSPGNSVYLLENGNLLRTGTVRSATFSAGGSGGIVEEIAPDGTVVWSFRYADERVQAHHDIESLPNGNILMIAWEFVSMDAALAAGRNPDTITAEGIWPDHIIEVNPETNQIVWEWHVWDHLIQDEDPTKENYGVVADHPELIDLNFGTKRSGNPDWQHTNSIDYHPDLDQIMLSVHGFNEIWVIDHSTTTGEAAGHSGGNYGKGGDILYRWGNPQAYDAGASADQKLFAQHDAQWIPAGLPGAGSVLVFNNGQKQSGLYCSNSGKTEALSNKKEFSGSRKKQK